MKNIILTCALSIFIAVGWQYFRKMHELDSIHCYSQLSYVFYTDRDNDHKHIMDAGLILNLSGGKGTISLSGSLDNLYSIRRSAEVTYTVSNGDLFSLHSTKVDIYPSDNIPGALSDRYVYGYLNEKGKIQDIFVKKWE